MTDIVPLPNSEITFNVIILCNNITIPKLLLYDNPVLKASI